CKIVRCQKDDKAVTAWVRENGRWGTDKRKNRRSESNSTDYSSFHAGCGVKAYKIVQIQYIATHPVGLISAAHQAILHLSPVSKESFDSLSINVLLPA
ncbi:hypothetical protein OFO05_29765, partial [Escherichia coli]|nr:hypothetical protein [Escherichia coli]